MNGLLSNIYIYHCLVSVHTSNNINTCYLEVFLSQLSFSRVVQMSHTNVIVMYSTRGQVLPHNCNIFPMTHPRHGGVKNLGMDIQVYFIPLPSTEGLTELHGALFKDVVSEIFEQSVREGLPQTCLEFILRGVSSSNNDKCQADNTGVVKGHPVLSISIKYTQYASEITRYASLSKKNNKRNLVQACFYHPRNE